MKKTFILLYILVIASQVFSQTDPCCCWNTINTATTDWREPPHISSNDWDWTAETFDVFISGTSNPAASVFSPFWASSSLFTNNNLLYDFQQAGTAAGKDFHPEDGWELVAKDLGTPARPVTRPFFALYNKHTGKLRTFLLFPTATQGGLPSSAAIQVRFPEGEGIRMTALFQHMKPIGEAVEKLDRTLYADVPNNFSQNDNYWMYSEFVVAYDPCTCMRRSDLGKLNIEFRYFYITKTEIDAEIKGTIVEQVSAGQTVVSGNPAYSVNNGLIKNAIKKGQKGYKEWSKYQKSFNKYLKDYTDEMYRDKLWKSIQEVKQKDLFVYNDLIDELFINKGPGDINYNDFMNGNYTWDPQTLYTENDFLNKNYSDIKSLMSILPYIGTAIGVIDFFVGQSKKKTASPVKGPSVFEANLRLNGEMLSFGAASSVTMSLPGSQNEPVDNFIPDYNNILGVFNVLEIPEFEYFEIHPTVTNITSNNLDYDARNNCEKNYSNLRNHGGAPDVVFRQYKPKSDLKYVVNPASDMEVVSVEAAIVLSYNGSDPLWLEKPSDRFYRKAIPFYPKITMLEDQDKPAYWGYNVFGGKKIYYVPQFTVGTAVIDNNKGKLDDHIQVLSTLEKFSDNTKSAAVERIKSIDSFTNLQLAMVSSDYPLVDSSEIHFRTDYLPITCFDKQHFTVLGTDNFGTVYTKLFVRLKHKTDENVEPVIMVLSYDITHKLRSATMGARAPGKYSSSVWAKKWDYSKNLCCWKCPGAFDFRRVSLEDYLYTHYDFKLDTLPYAPETFSNYDVTYSGQRELTVMGNLIVPDNSILPYDANIKSAGKITFGKHVDYGLNGEFYSTNGFEFASNNFIPANAFFDIRSISEIKYNCGYKLCCQSSYR